MNNLKIIGLYIATMCLHLAADGQSKNRDKNNSRITNETVRFSGEYTGNLKHGDSIRITLWDDLYTDEKSLFIPHRHFEVPIKNGKFFTLIDSVKKLSYVSFSDVNDKWGNEYAFLKYYIVEPGDIVNIKLNSTSPIRTNFILNDKGDSTCTNCSVITFKGCGADKYNCRFKMEKAFLEAWETYNYQETKEYYQRLKTYQEKGQQLPIPTLVQESERLQRRIDFLLEKSTIVLKFFENRLSEQAYAVLKADLIGKTLSDLYLRPMSIRTSMASADWKLNYQPLFLENYDHNNYGVSDLIAQESVYYSSFLLARSQLKSLLFSGESKKNETKDKPYYIIKSTYNGFLRDRLLTSYVINNLSSLNDNWQLLEDCINTVKTVKFSTFLNSAIQNNTVGHKAYNFSLPDSTDRLISLSDYKGKIVFVDFWFTGCNGCADYYKNVLSKVEEDFKKNKDIVFISVALDANKNNWEKGISSNLYTSSTAINLYKAAASPVIKQFSIVAYPQPIIIDKEGRIFCNSETELRAKGIDSLKEKLKEALESN